jgi:hypothetical protein
MIDSSKIETILLNIRIEPKQFISHKRLISQKLVNLGFKGFFHGFRFRVVK